MLVRSGSLDLVVIDSVAALVPRAEIEGEMGDTHVGLQARLMSQAMRKLAGTLSKFDTSAIFINQLREKIGVMFGSPETTPGGRALKFYSSVRLDVRKIENLKDGTDVVGSRTRVKVVKNKIAPPFRQCEFDIMYGKGISKEGSLIDVGVDLEIVKKAGAWFTYEGDQLGQGRENARQFLAEHVDVRDDIERKVREAVGLTDFGAEGDETPIEIVPDLVLDDADGTELGKLTRDVTEFLASIEPLQSFRRVVRRDVTLQESCHLVHGQRIKEAPRKLLASIPGVELRDMAHPDLCCGSAGLYMLTQPELSTRILDDKMRDVASTGASTIVTANPGCMMQLQRGMQRAKIAGEVKHVVELLDEAYGGGTI